MSNAPIIRTLDIETAPNLAHVWAFFKQNIGLEQVMANDFIMSYAYKTFGKEDAVCVSARNCYLQRTPQERKDYKQFIRGLRDVLDEADAIIAHNGKRFDIPWIIGQCVEYGISPPSPFKCLDTCLEARKAFRLPSYKLDYLTKRFKCSKKSPHKKYPGHSLWAQCLAGNLDAWDEMEKYNLNDVFILEELYLKIRAYLPARFNWGIFETHHEEVCPVCGGHHLNKRGFYHTNVSRFQRYQCQDCGAWSRGRFNLLDKVVRKNLLVPAL